MKNWFNLKKKSDYYIIYTLLFLGMTVIFLAFFNINGKSVIWKQDGIRQHMNSLAYYGRYLRQIAKTLLLEHRLEIPMWDMHIGYGSDIISTLHYYVIGEPLNLLSIFVLTEKTHILYQFLIFLRLYLAGIAFSMYCFSNENSKTATLVGTILYLTTGWVFFACMRHPYFATPMIYLPMLLLGIDKVYKGKRPHFFIGSVFLAAVSNFYFFYMLCIFMFIYAAFRYFSLFRKRSVKDVLGWFGRFVGYFAIGFAMAGAIFLPVIMALFGTDRFAAENHVPIFYNPSYYEKYLGCLIGQSLPKWGITGFCAISMSAVFVLFAKKKKNPQLKLGFLFLNLLLLFPFAGHVINGFSYVSNRWMWAYSMLLSYIFVKVAPELFHLTVNEKKKILAMNAAYVILAVAGEKGRILQNCLQLVLLSLSVLVLILCGTRIFKKRYMCVLLAGLGICSILLNTYVLYCRGFRYIDEFAKKEIGMKVYYTGIEKAVKKTGDNTVYRYDQFWRGEAYENSTLQNGTSNTGYYFSLANGYISEFFRENYLNSAVEFRYQNLDCRTILERLAAVKYYALREGTEFYIPYGYIREQSRVRKRGKTYLALANDNYLPLGYTYDSWIPREEYEALSAPKKQEALTQGVVLEDSTLPSTEIRTQSRELDCSIKALKRCAVQDGSILAKRGAKLEITFSGLENSETSFMVENLVYTPMKNRDIKLKKSSNAGDGQNSSAVENNGGKGKNKKNIKNYLNYGEQNKIKGTFIVSNGVLRKKLNVLTYDHFAYCGAHDFMVNMGYQDAAQNRFVITFKNPGKYTFDSIKAVCQPVKPVEENIRALGEEAMENVTLGTNEICGNVTVSKPKALLLAVPYSKGFRAFVDGEETEIKRANTMYMAVELPKGTHEIRFVYCTPYIRLGFALTVAGMMSWLILRLLERRLKNRGSLKGI